MKRFMVSLFILGGVAVCQSAHETGATTNVHAIKTNTIESLDGICVDANCTLMVRDGVKVDTLRPATGHKVTIDGMAVMGSGAQTDSITSLNMPQVTVKSELQVDNGLKVDEIKPIAAQSLKVDSDVDVVGKMRVNKVSPVQGEVLTVASKLKVDDTLSVDVIEPVTDGSLRVRGSLEASSGLRSDALSPLTATRLMLNGEVLINDLKVNSLGSSAGQVLTVDGDLNVTGHLGASGVLSVHGLSLNNSDILGVKNLVVAQGGSVKSNSIQSLDGMLLHLNAQQVNVGTGFEFIPGMIKVCTPAGVVRARLDTSGLMVFNDQKGVDTIVFKGGYDGRSEVNVYGRLCVDGNLVHPSDARLKESIEIIIPAESLAKVLTLQPSTYVLKREKCDNDEQPRHRGFIAQQVAEVSPELVSIGTNERVIDGETITDILAIDYNGFIVDLVGAVQELHRQVDELRARVAELKG